MTGTMVTDAPPDGSDDNGPEMASCVDCLGEFDPDTMTAKSFGDVCETCDEHWFNCDECSDDVHGEQVTYFDDKWLCESCHDEVAATCEDCGETGTRDDMREIDGHGHVCDSCAEEWYTCEHCGCDSHADYVRSMGDMTLCDGCYCDNVTWCEHCEDEYWRDEGPSCDCEEHGELIHSYGYKPDPIFHGAPVHGAYLGVELEIEATSGNAHDMARLVNDQIGGYGYLKSDGSLSNGFELVTHPASLDEHLRLMPWATLRDIANQGARSWQAGTCGVHVHVSRKTFSDAHLGRFLWLFYNNVRQWKQLAGRSSDRWAPFDDATRCRIGKIAKKTHRPCERYTAVNLTNHATVEVRIFRGTLNHDTLRGYMAAMAAAVEYTRHASIVTVSRDGFDGLRRWAATHDEYRPFVELADRKVP
jgi:hypothetical protein